MKKMSVSLLLGLLCLSLVVMLVPGCTTSKEANPVKIGLLITYTGGPLPFGTWYENAAKLACDNVGWEVAGRPIQLIMEDDAYDPNIAVDKARKLVEYDQVDGIVGPILGSEFMAVAGYTKNTGTPLVALVEEPIDALRTGGNNVVLPWGTVRGVSYSLGLHAYDESGYRTAATIYSDFVAGTQFMDGFEGGFTEEGGTIIQRQAVPLGTMDFAPYLTNLKEADCLCLWLAGVMGPFLKQYYDFGLDIPIYMIDGRGVEPTTMAELGDNALGIVSEFHDVLDNPSAAHQQFFDGWKKNYGDLPSTPDYAEGMYTGVTVFLAAVKATGGDTTPAKIIEAWKTVKVETPNGFISFDEEGCAIGNLYLTEYSKNPDGTYYWKLIKTYEDKLIKLPGE